MVYADLTEELFVPSMTYFDANVGIGTTNPKEKLSVNGNIRSREIKVENGNWPDYVFEPDYPMMSLTALDSYIKNNKHLPDVPTAKEVELNGVDLGQLGATLLKKIEEMSLQLIEMKKENEQMKKEIELLKRNKQ